MYNTLQEYIDRYPSMFDAYTAERTNLPTGENDCYIKFKKQGTYDGYMEFIYIGGYLTVQGDYGNASFTWFNSSNTIEQMAGFAKNIGYFLSKMHSGEKSDIPYSWNKRFDQDECTRIVEEYIVDYEVECDDDWRYKTEDWIEWASFLRESGTDYFGDDHQELYHAGEETNTRPFIWAYGLIKAVEKLKEQDV